MVLLLDAPIKSTPKLSGSRVSGVALNLSDIRGRGGFHGSFFKNPAIESFCLLEVQGVRWDAR